VRVAPVTRRYGAVSWMLSRVAIILPDRKVLWFRYRRSYIVRSFRSALTATPLSAYHRMQNGLFCSGLLILFRIFYDAKRRHDVCRSEGYRIRGRLFGVIASSLSCWSTFVHRKQDNSQRSRTSVRTVAEIVNQYLRRYLCCSRYARQGLLESHIVQILDLSVSRQLVGRVIRGAG